MKRVLSLLTAILMITAVLCACAPAAEPLSLDQTELSMTVGDSVKLSAGEATKVNWTSSDDKIASVSAGTVSAKSAGAAVITASLENGEKATCNVTVADKLITSITLSAASARVEEGKTIQLTATFAPSDASNRTLTWSSSDEDVAVVNELGYVTAVSEGVASVTCESVNGVKASCTVTVGGITVPPTSAATLPPTEKPTERKKPTEAKKADDDDDDDDDDEPTPSADYYDGCVFPESSSRYLSEGEVAARLDSLSGSPVTDSYTQDAVNEIYARHGYVFRTPSIRAYYESLSWYRADPSYDGSVTDIEQYNIDLILGY